MAPDGTLKFIWLNWHEGDFVKSLGGKVVKRNVNSTSRDALFSKRIQITGHILRNRKKNT